MNGQRFNDLVINIAQKVLKMQFPGIKGFQSIFLQEKRGKRTFHVDKVQIRNALTWESLDSGRNHRDYLI